MSFLLALALLGCGLTRRWPWPERLPAVGQAALVWVMGSAAGGWLTMLWCLAGGRPGPAWAAGLGLLGLGLALTAPRAAASPAVTTPAPPSGLGPRLTTGLAGLLAIGLLGLVSLASLAVNDQAWDFFAIWGLKAKALASGAGLAAPVFHDPQLLWSHPRYPLLWPAQMAGCLAQGDALGGQVAVWWLRPLHYGATLGLLLSLLRPVAGQPLAWALALLTMASPVVLSHAITGYADASVMLHFAAVLLGWQVWLATPTRATLLLLTVATIALALTKDEGALLALSTAAVHLLPMLWQAWRSGDPVLSWRAGPWRHLVLAASLAALAVGLPRLLLQHYALPDANPYASDLGPARLLAQAERLPEILNAMGRYLSTPSLWGGLTLLLAASALLGWRAWRLARVRWLWLLLAGQLAVIVLAYWISRFAPSWQIPTSLDRLLLQLAPLLALLTAQHLAACRGPAGPPVAS